MQKDPQDIERQGKGDLLREEDESQMEQRWPEGEVWQGQRLVLATLGSFSSGHMAKLQFPASPAYGSVICSGQWNVSRRHTLRSGGAQRPYSETEQHSNLSHCWRRVGRSSQSGMPVA